MGIQGKMAMVLAERRHDRRIEEGIETESNGMIVTDKMYHFCAEKFDVAAGPDSGYK